MTDTLFLGLRRGVSLLHIQHSSHWMAGSGDSALYCPPLCRAVFHDMARLAGFVLAPTAASRHAAGDGGAGPQPVIERDASAVHWLPEPGRRAEGRNALEERRSRLTAARRRGPL
jgi:hypothetical protein